MKLLIASDIHGDLESAKLVTEVFENEKCDKILLLGDLLYHGPRNDLNVNLYAVADAELGNVGLKLLINKSLDLFHFMASF